MAAIVGVHGIFVWDSHADPAAIQREWWPFLARSVDAANGVPARLRSTDVAAAYYWDVFDHLEPLPPDLAERRENWEEGFCDTLSEEVMRLLRQGMAKTKHPALLAAAAALARTPLIPRFLRLMLGRLVAQVLGFTVKHASRYFHDQGVRGLARLWFLSSLQRDTRVVIAHSLGSVVAYEALAMSGRSLDLLVTIGSPLGIPGLYFDRLHPAPVRGQLPWPAGVRRWLNISQSSDWVAVVKEFAPLVHPGPAGQTVEDHLVPGPLLITQSHMAKHYLLEPVLARAVAAALWPEAAGARR